MSGMDRLTDEALEYLAQGGHLFLRKHVTGMARELLAHRRASQADPAPVAWRGKHFHPESSAWIYKDGPEKPATAFGSIGQLEPLYRAPAPSDGLREALATLSAAADYHRKLAKDQYDKGIESWISNDWTARKMKELGDDIRAALALAAAQEGEPRHD